MWIVFDADEQIIILTDDRREAIKEYEKTKKSWEGQICGDEIGGDELGVKVVLAKVEKTLSLSITEQTQEGNIADFVENEF